MLPNQQIKNNKHFVEIIQIIRTSVFKCYNLEEKNIDIVLDRKNIFIANRNIDITNEIIKIIDAKIK